jgi:cell division inhibitor SepF
LDPVTRQQNGGGFAPASVPSQDAPPEPAAGQQDLLVFMADRFEDAETVITAVRGGRSVVLNAAGLPDVVGQRLVDFVCGGITAMDGQVHRIGEGVFLMAPALARVEEDSPPADGAAL